jgi:hypothetical protein
VAGEVQSLDLKLITLSEAANVSRRWAVWKPWTVVIAGGVFVATGGAFHARSSQDFTQYDSQFSSLPCVNAPPHGCKTTNIPDDLKAKLNSARQERDLAVAGYVVGGGLIATGVVLLYMNRPRLFEQPTTSSPAGRVAVVPTVSAEMVGILIRMRH